MVQHGLRTGAVVYWAAHVIKFAVGCREGMRVGGAALENQSNLTEIIPGLPILTKISQPAVIPLGLIKTTTFYSK
jgi:hypothetical protein